MTWNIIIYVQIGYYLSNNNTHTGKLRTVFLDCHCQTLISHCTCAKIIFLQAKTGLKLIKEIKSDAKVGANAYLTLQEIKLMLHKTILVYSKMAFSSAKHPTYDILICNLHIIVNFVIYNVMARCKQNQLIYINISTWKKA